MFFKKIKKFAKKEAKKIYTKRFLKEIKNKFNKRKLYYFYYSITTTNPRGK